jgi:lysozyme
MVMRLAKMAKMAKMKNKTKAIIAGSALTALLGVGAAVLVTEKVGDFEGEVFTPYLDIAGIWTVCYGDTNDIDITRDYTHEECVESLQDELAKHAKSVLLCTPQIVDLSDGEKAAHVSLAYNIGTGAYCGSTAARLVRSGDREGACKAISMWDRSRGKREPGLVRRRAAERKMCLAGLQGAVP